MTTKAVAVLACLAVGGLLWAVNQEDETAAYDSAASVGYEGLPPVPPPPPPPVDGEGGQLPQIQDQPGQEGIRLSTNPYLGPEVSEYDPRVSPYSPDGAMNPYTTGGGRIYAEDGTYLGKLNSNQYDPESVSNPYGQYGSEYSPNSINNPYGTYGSEYSPQSPTNPYSATPPVVVYDTPYDY